MIKPDYDDPDLAVVAEVADEDVRVVFQHHLDGELDDPSSHPRIYRPSVTTLVSSNTRSKPTR